MSKGAKFDQQRDKDQDDCENERLQQLTKARLLLLVKSAVLHGHAGREFYFLREQTLDFIVAGAKILALQSPCDRNRLAQAIAMDLRLAFVVTDLRHLT